MYSSGITPACAGKTPARSRQGCRKADHPRMRGEDDGDGGDYLIIHGSPPHARGRRRSFGRRVAASGITPACAGKTGAFRNGVTCATDHPRMRGEDSPSVRGSISPGGSPPHARGRQPKHWPMLVRWRITPACAGKTFLSVLLGDRPPGSPPHARGRQVVNATGRPEPGITPACAGKTVRFPRESGKVVFQPTSFPSLPT